jgi:orotate phosphoribosyltransferase
VNEPGADGFVRWLINQDVLRFGDFVLKSGRRSPYFFNLGKVATGAALAHLGRCYARRIVELGWHFDVLFGPAYKGIPIAVATAIGLADDGREVPVAFNRKEAKDHGEGGLFVGAPIEGRVLLIDDVLTAGTAVREAAGLIAGRAELAGVVIALDREECNAAGVGALAALGEELDVPVAALATLTDVIGFLDRNPQEDKHPPGILESIRAYRQEYCIPRS